MLRQRVKEQVRGRDQKRTRPARFVWLLGAALMIGLGASAQSTTKGEPPHAKTAAAKTASAKPAPALSAPVKTYGSKSAPITMEVFTDYQCPSCRSLYEQTLRPMIADYVASGKVYLIHHDFPLAGHQHSGQAARWANAAARVGKFEIAEAALYDNQQSWETSGDIEKYMSGAMSAADFARVQKAMQSCEAPGPTASPNGAGVSASPHPCALDGYIAEDIMAGIKVPVHSTPTYVISYKGQQLPAGSGVVSWPVLKQFLDSLLQR